MKEATQTGCKRWTKGISCKAPLFKMRQKEKQEILTPGLIQGMERELKRELFC